MATYYAITGGGNWQSAGTWNTASNQATGNAGAAPTASDTCYLDQYSGNVTVGAASAAAAVNCTGYTGTLTISTNYTLTVAGNITLSATMTLAGAGGITSSNVATITSNGITGANFTFSGVLSLSGGNKTLNCNGTTWPSVTFGGSYTYTLSSALQATTLTLGAPSVTCAGAFGITVGSLINSAGGNSTHTFVAGQTVTVSTALRFVFGVAQTIKSSSASTAFNLVYNGTAANCAVANCLFTDVAYSGGTVTTLDNWYGGTLTRTSGITNRTSADIGSGGGGRPAYSDRSGGKS